MRIPGWVSTIPLLVAVGSAPGQERLTPEIGARISAGVGRMTEDEVLKLVPGPSEIEMSEPDADGDYVINWYEARRILVVFSNDRVVSASADFSDAVGSKTLTLANFKKIKRGMAVADVKKILGGPSYAGSITESEFLDPSTRKIVGQCEWMEGIRVFARIKDGRVVAGGSIRGRG